MAENNSARSGAESGWTLGTPIHQEAHLTRKGALTLYSMTDEYRALKEAGEMVDTETGEVVSGDALEAVLAGLKGDITQKAAGCLAVASEFRHRAAAFQAEEERLAKAKRAFVAAEERLRKYVRDRMAEAGLKKLEAATFRITLIEGRETVAADPDRMEDVPETHRVYSWKPDTKAATEQFKANGTLPPGFTTKRGEPYVRIV